MDDLKESIIKKLSRKEIRYDDINIPAQLREDKDVAIAALNSYDGRICKYLGEQFEIHLHDSCNIKDIEIYALKVR